jgi:hypothetical protein
MKNMKYLVTLSRDVLMTCPGGSGVLQTDTVEAVLLVPDVPRAIATTFEGKRDEFRFHGPWKIVKMDVEIHDPSEDVKTPEVESGKDRWRSLRGTVDGARLASTERARTLALFEVLLWMHDLDKGSCMVCGGDEYHQPCTTCGEGVLRKDNDPPDESDGGFRYQDMELEEFQGVELPRGRFVLRRTADDNRFWDREKKAWGTAKDVVEVGIGLGLRGGK